MPYANPSNAPRTRRLTPALLAALGMVASASVAFAQNANAEQPAGLERTPFGAMLNRLGDARPGAAQPPAPPSLEAALIDLGSDRFEIREAATAALIDDAGVSEDDLVRAAQREDLMPEQRERLSLVLRERFMRSDRPALGVQMAGGGRGVQIDPQEGFPARHVLKTGDIVTSIDGIDLRGSDVEFNQAQVDMRTAIMSHLPGETVALAVQRGDDALEIHAPLGLYANLRQPAQGVVPQQVRDELSYVLPAAWLMRAARLGLIEPASDAIESQAGPDAWIRSTRQAYRPEAGDGIIGGGHAPSVAATVRVASMLDGPNQRRMIMQPNDGAVIRVLPEPARNPFPDFMLAKIEEIQTQIEQARAALSRPDLPRADRARLNEFIRRAERQVKELQQITPPKPADAPPNR